MSGNRTRRAVGLHGPTGREGHLIDHSGHPIGRASPPTGRTRQRTDRAGEATAGSPCRPTGSGRHPTDVRRWRRGRDDDRGSATIWTVGGIAVLMLVAAVIVEVGAATVVRHRAEAAADLAALAAAEHATDGQSAACDRARWVAEGMRVRVDRCWLRGWDALVEVSAPPAGLLTSYDPAHARAMAGPANPVDGQTAP